MTLSRTVSVPVSASLTDGPVIADINIQPDTVTTAPPAGIEVTFSGNVNPATLTIGTFILRYSPDPSFFDGNDTLIADDDGVITWEPTSIPRSR